MVGPLIWLQAPVSPKHLSVLQPSWQSDTLGVVIAFQGDVLVGECGTGNMPQAPESVGDATVCATVGVAGIESV